MMPDDTQPDPGAPSWLRRSLPPAFRQRRLVLAPNRMLPYAAADWHDALVVVVQGHLELEALDERRYGFGAGAVLSLERLPLRALHNRGRCAVVLAVVSRRAATAEP